MAKKIGKSKITGIPELVPTVAEQLLLWRREKKWTQAKAAAHFDVSVYNYKLMELGAFPVSKIFTKLKTRFLKSLLPHERCLLYRRRCGVTQETVATEMGICRYWLRLKELGKVSCEDLLGYWES